MNFISRFKLLLAIAALASSASVIAGELASKPILRIDPSEHSAAQLQTCDPIDGPKNKNKNPEPITISRSSPTSPPNDIHLGQWLTIEIPADKSSHFTIQANNVAPTPVLYLNHMAINGLESTSESCNSIAFHLTRTEESKNIFGVLLRRSEYPVNVGIGTIQEGFITDIAKIKFGFNGAINVIVWIVGILAFVVGTLFLAAKTDLLRDIPKSSAPAQEEILPYSLARVQMAWWFLLTVSAFSGIWFVTGELSSIPNSIIGLMGISSVTTIMSAVIDTANNNGVANSQKTKGLLLDILTDNERISFHRFQMLIWTILLGGIFFIQVRNNYSMPDFDSQLLGLMGVASGTYLGFKIPATGK